MSEFLQGPGGGGRGDEGFSHHLLDLVDQSLGVKGFGDVTVGAAAGSLLGIKIAPFGSQHDDSCVGGVGELPNRAADGVGVVSGEP